MSLIQHHMMAPNYLAPIRVVYGGGGSDGLNPSTYFNPALSVAPIAGDVILITCGGAQNRAITAINGTLTGWTVDNAFGGFV